MLIVDNLNESSLKEAWLRSNLRLIEDLVEKGLLKALGVIQLCRFRWQQQ